LVGTRAEKNLRRGVPKTNGGKGLFPKEETSWEDKPHFKGKERAKKRSIIKNFLRKKLRAFPKREDLVRIVGKCNLGDSDSKKRSLRRGRIRRWGKSRRKGTGCGN